MPIILGSSLKNGVAGAPDKPLLTPEQVVEHLRALREQIPEFVQLPRNEVDQIRREASVTIDFARAAITAVGSSEIVQTVIGNSPDELHQAEDELSRWSVVENEFRSILRGVTLANLVRRHRLGRVVLQAYHVSKQLVREEAHAQLLPHVEAMNRIKRFGRRRPKSAGGADPQKPVPPQPATVS
jgi:hypothetical protein